MADKKYELTARMNESFKPIKFRLNGKNHYQVFLGIKSTEFDPALSHVSYVEYELHPTFKQPIRISKNAHNNFEIEIMTWGTFVVKYKVLLKDGNTYSDSINYGEVLNNDTIYN